MKPSRIDEILLAEGLRWRSQESRFGERVDPEFAEKRGGAPRSTRKHRRGTGGVCGRVSGRDGARRRQELPWPAVGPGAARPGWPAPDGASQAGGRLWARGKGYVFGAFRPSTGEALTVPYQGRTIANARTSWSGGEAWIPAELQRGYAILDNLSAHRATDVLLFSLAHPRWEFVFQPTYAPYLNLIEPWWKIFRSQALKGRHFERWEEVCDAVREATAYGNAHRHPFLWGRRRRHQPRRRPGIALPAKVA